MEPSAEICEGFCTAICKTAYEMTLFQDTGGDPRAASLQLADVLAWYGAVGDAALGNTPGFAVRKASLAVALGTIAQLAAHELDALYFAGLLHAVGAIGNAAYRKGSELSQRVARLERWDVPAQGARICASIPQLPVETADMVRWQAECWDGTGYPDQLRWHSIPLHAQLLALADGFVRATDPDEAVSAIGLQSGRAYGPENARLFLMWFHTNGGDVEPLGVPSLALNTNVGNIDTLFDTIADHIDSHNGVGNRWRRIAKLASAAATAQALDSREARALGLACRLYGAGEITAATVENERFDALGRLGIEQRARNAVAAADIAQPFATFADAMPIVRARAEWFDGTGLPRAARHAEIPASAGILAASIACATLDRIERLEDAAGTQFAPAHASAVLAAAKARA